MNDITPLQPENNEPQTSKQDSPESIPDPFGINLPPLPEAEHQPASEPAAPIDDFTVPPVPSFVKEPPAASIPEVIPPLPPSYPVEPPKSNKKRTGIIIAVVVALLLCCCCLVLIIALAFLSPEVQNYFNNMGSILPAVALMA
jgi:hypothetical protein